MRALWSAVERRDPVGLPTFTLLSALLLVLAVGAGRVSEESAVGVTVVALGLSALLRVVGGRDRVSLALVPTLIVLAFLSVVTPLSILSELLVGISALVALAWLTDGAGLPRGALRSVTDLLLLPAVGFGLALGGTLLLPPGELRVGIASLLLVVALVLAALILVRPERLRPRSTARPPRS
ncbi:MAG: hypothetical protein ACREBZ_04380 [Thermoplasmata archaeon]